MLIAILDEKANANFRRCRGEYYRQPHIGNARGEYNTRKLRLLDACFDVDTRWQIDKGIRKNFNNPDYRPATNDPSFSKIMERRKVAEWFLFEKPHLIKDSLRALGCAVAFALASYAYFPQLTAIDWRTHVVNAVDCVAQGHSAEAVLPATLAYIVLFANLIIHEFIITRVGDTNETSASAERRSG